MRGIESGSRFLPALCQFGFERPPRDRTADGAGALVFVPRACEVVGIHLTRRKNISFVLVKKAFYTRIFFSSPHVGRWHKFERQVSADGANSCLRVRAWSLSCRKGCPLPLNSRVNGRNYKVDDALSIFSDGDSDFCLESLVEVASAAWHQVLPTTSN